MHRALIVSSKYDPATGYPDREAWRVSNKRLGLRLQQHGYAVEWLEPGAGLVRKLREALATEDPLSAVVLVFSGYVLLTESGDPALLLSDEQVIALRLEQLCSKASRTFGRVLLVLDGVRGSSTRIVNDANPDAGEVNAETLLARMAVRTIRSDNTGMLVRIAPWGAPDTLPDAGLCEQLSRILENLDDAQALATPELELDLLDGEADDGSAVSCRHSKPAFVFLPARRFASEPPKAPAQAGAPQLDDGVDPYAARESVDDREAWTPPPDQAVPSYSRSSSHDDSDAGGDDSDEAPTLTSEGAADSEASVSRPPNPPWSAGEVPSVEPPHLVSPAPTKGPALDVVAPIALSVPPLPVVAPPLPVVAPPLPVVAPPLPVVAPPPSPGGLPPDAPNATQSLPAPRSPITDTLGTPPPLPFERNPAATQAHASEPAPFRASVAPRAPKELGTPPPLPSERAAAGAAVTIPPLAAIPLPGEPIQSLPPSPIPAVSPAVQPNVPPAPPPPPLPPLASGAPHPSTAAPPLPSLLVPPPLVQPPQPVPSVEAATAGGSEPPAALAPRRDLGQPPPLPSERLASDSASAGVADATPGSSETLTPQEPESTSAGPQTLPTADWAREPRPEAAPTSIAPPTAEANEQRPSQSPSKPGPPPRRHRDSAAPDAPPAGAPSLPPPVVSPESWRPQAPRAESPRDEAALLERAQAYLTADQPDLALSHAKECLTSFPESATALQIAGNVLVSQGNFEALAELYDELIARLAPTPAAQLCAAASRLWHNQLNDPTRARALLERGLQLDVDNPSLQRELADLLDAAGAHEEALVHSIAALRANPFSPAAAQSTFQRLSNGSARELQFTVACLLSFLGHTSNRVADVIAAHRGATLPRPSRSLSEDDYRFGLDVTETDPELTRALALLEPYARQLEVPKAKQQRQLLESLRAEDVERSTTMLARTFGWTCRLLTLGTPGLYLSDADSLPQLLPVDGTHFVVGKSLGRGLSVSELAFLWGRTLSWSRPQTRILFTLSTSVKLGQFVRAARVAGGLEEPNGAETKALAKTLRKEILGQTWDILLPALVALGPQIEERVDRWKHAADRTANRVGLLTSGDPELAARTLDRFPTTDGGSRKTQLSELLSYSLSEQYHELRQRLGLHLG